MKSFLKKIAKQFARCIIDVVLALRLGEFVFKNRVLFINEKKLAWYGINSGNVGISLFKYKICGILLSFENVGKLYHSTQKLRYLSDEDIDIAIEYVSKVDIVLFPELAAKKREVNLREAFNMAISIENAVRKLRPTQVVYVQGFYPESVLARILAEKLSIRCVAIDMPFVADKIIVETRTGIAVNRTSAKKDFEENEGLLDSLSCGRYRQSFVHSIERRKQVHHISGSISSSDRVRIRKPYCLFLGQVLIDSSLLSNQQSFDDPCSLLTRVHQFCELNGLNLVIKCHPQENGGMSALGHRLTKNLYSKIRKLEVYSNVLIDHENSFNTTELIVGSKFVVTMNSQSAFEAALLDKAAVVCGEAYYAKLGFTYDVESPDLLESVLEEALFSGISKLNFHRRDKFLKYLIEQFFVPKNYNALMNVLRKNNYSRISGKSPSDKS